MVCDSDIFKDGFGGGAGDHVDIKTASGMFSNTYAWGPYHGLLNTSFFLKKS